MGKLQNPDPLKTVQLYKSMGLTDADFPIQLDLPPRWHLPRDERLRLIERTAIFYHIMVQHISSTIPVIHGWTADELRYALSLIEEEEKFEKLLGVGSYEATSVVSPRAVGSFLCDAYPQPPLLNCSGHPPMAVGTFLASNYRTTPPGRRAAIGTFLGETAPRILDHVVSNGKPRVVATPNEHHVVSNGKPRTIATPHHRAEQTVLRTPSRVVMDRLAMVLNMFKDRELFMLGGASPNDMHILFCAGAKYADSSSWRIKAMVANLFIPYDATIVSVGTTENAPRPNKGQIKVIQESLREPTNPLNGMTVKSFLELVSLNQGEWRKRDGHAKWGWTPFDARAAWNAWVLKFKEQITARDFACDPERYHNFLLKHRFNGHPNLTRKMESIWSALKQPYTQETMSIFLKTRASNPVSLGEE